MKTFKIIFGFLLLFGAGREYINASRQLGSLLSPGIVIGILITLIFSTWLIGSSFSDRKFKFKSFEFLKFFTFSFVTFAIVALFNISSKIAPSDFVEINGLKIPIGKCIYRNREVILDKKEREKYCKCFIEKITNEPNLKSKYQRKLENNELDDVFKEVQSSPMFSELGIEDCMSSIQMNWTNNIANLVKNNWKKQLEGTEFESTNNIEKYCVCLIKECRKFPLNKVLRDDFNESKEAIEIDKKCTKLSKK